jgi:hypothetical protein
VVFPRALYPTVKARDEFHQPGVYLLLGASTEGNGEMIYVGEGDPVRHRFDDHYAKKDFWTRGVFVVAGPGQLNKAHVQYLEARLVARAAETKRTILDNANVPAPPSLSEADRANMDVFLENILGILPVLGIHAFEKGISTTSRRLGAELTCKSRAVTATGYESSQGFLVKQGSQAALAEVQSLIDHASSVSVLRTELQRNGVLVRQGASLKFTQDFTFTSPSLAAAVVLGRTANGRIEWKDGLGQTLKKIQEKQTTA